MIQAMDQPPQLNQERYEQALADQLRESQAMYEISQILAKSLDLPVVLREIVDAATTYIENAEQAIIHLIDEAGVFLKSAAIARGDNLPIRQMNFKPGQGIAGLVISSGETINVEDIDQDPRYIPSSGSQPPYKSLLVAPVKYGQHLLGTLSVHGKKVKAFDQRATRLLTVLGSLAAQALEKAQLLKEEKEQRQLAEALSEVGVYLGTTPNMDSALAFLLTQMKSVVPYDTASVLVIEKGQTHVTQMAGYETVRPALREHIKSSSFEIEKVPYLKEMQESGNPIILSTTNGHPLMKGALMNVKSWAGAPIQAQGKTIAFFSLSKAEPGFYQPRDAKRLLSFAGQASLTLQNVNLFETTQRRLRDVNILFQISQAITESLDIDVILKQVIYLLQENFKFYYVQVFMVDKATGELCLSQGSGEIGSKLKQRQFKLSPGSGIPRQVAVTFHPFVSNQVDEVPFFQRHALLAETVAELAVPLRSGERLLGVLDIHHKAPSVFSDHDLQLMATIADEITIAMDKAILYADLQTTLVHEQAARAQLVQSEKLAALGRIVASVAHELNNPLQAIQNALYLINMEESLNKQAKDDLQVALNEADRMAGLIGRLRDTYRPTTIEEFQPVSLNKIISEIEKLLATHLRHNQVTFNFSPDPVLPMCEVIQDQIKQVALNICLNAVESMRQGGSLSITTRYDRHSSKVAMIFSDTGSGITPEVLPNIFDPFVTTKEGGTGLGLAITYDIVQRHRGRIDVESKPGKGTTFTVWIPVDHIEE